MERKISVFFPNSVIDYFDELLLILYNKNYFSYKSSASDYVLKIYDFIENNISTFPHRITPNELKYLGSKYIFYKPNKKTTWYIFFENTKSEYTVTSIMNNYCKEFNML